MKKYLIGASIICLILALTGCGNNGSKTLVCTQSTSGVDIELTTNIKENLVNDMSMKYTMNLSSYNDVQIKAIKEQDFCTLVKGSMVGYENAFSNCKQDISNKRLLITADIDVKKVTDESIKEETTPEDAKKALESEGYTCVIK